jgi:hypothetical protein
MVCKAWLTQKCSDLNADLFSGMLAKFWVGLPSRPKMLAHPDLVYL